MWICPAWEEYKPEEEYKFLKKSKHKSFPSSILSFNIQYSLFDCPNQCYIAKAVPTQPNYILT